ncbi:protein toll-like [Ruditapes philippinarum]|uniref:protein toll-like n=1 Tax=Ruditapes philippinarum TaxID=129788 RepID=UPI00295A6F31|nr:protein toll-like [Ruditapes philippinarum]
MAETYLKILLSLAFIYNVDTETWNVNSLKNAKLVCDYDKDMLRLDIREGFVESEVIHCLETYPETETLVFTNSRLKTIPGYLSSLKNLDTLDLSFNELVSVSFIGLERTCVRLKRLVLDSNAIRVLRKGSLDCLESLQKFSIANNSLERIENGTFNTKLKSIDYIHLVNNSLTQLDSSLYSKLLLYSNIRLMVNASFNRITGVTNSLNVSINDISSSSSILAILLHNNITRLNTEYYFKKFNVTHPFPQLLRLWNSGFDARFNPFICDCSLYPLSEALRNFYKMDPDNPVFSITCGSPRALDGMMVRKVNEDQFNCSVTQNCPESCTCTETIALDLVTIRCNDDYLGSDLPTSFPAAGKLHIDMKSTQMTKLSSRTYLQNVTVLDVSGCSITDIDPSIVNTLDGGIIKTIFLHDNNLKYIPRTFQSLNFTEGEILTIDGNPFICDCHSLWMKKWLLSNKNHVVYQDKIKCTAGSDADRPVITIPDNQFTCGTGLSLKDVFIITLGSLAGSVLLATLIVCKINSIQVVLISNFGICKYCLRRRKQRRLQYDIFIAHSCDDDVTITKIVDFLENQTPPYKVCIAERNFRIARPIPENILSAIESSHTTLLVISNSFLRSAWCNMEFREAHMRFLKDRNVNMVLIVLEELDKELIYEELRLYLQTHVYLKFTDKYFCAKLLQNIPIMIQSDKETDPLLPK